MIEVAGNERDVNVAAFANGLSIVHSFEDGQAAGVLLDLTSEGVEKTGAFVRGFLLPSGEGHASSLHGGIDIGGASLGDFRERRARGRIGGLEICSIGGGVPRAVNEVAEFTVVMVEPGKGLFWIFGSRAVFHSAEFFNDAHIAFCSSTGPRLIPLHQNAESEARPQGLKPHVGYHPQVGANTPAPKARDRRRFCDLSKDASGLPLAALSLWLPALSFRGGLRRVLGQI